MDEAVYVYILTAGEHVKIGIAVDVSARVANLQLASPVRIEVAHQRQFKSRESARLAERALHLRFAYARKWGEWFALPLAEAVEALKSAAEAELPVKLPTGPRAWPQPEPVKRAPAPKVHVPIERDGPTFEEFEAMSDADWCDNMRSATAVLDWTKTSTERADDAARINADLRKRYPQFYGVR